jgi:hypothetical protein
MKGIEIFVVAMKGVPLEVVLRSLPKICRTGVVTSHPGKLRHQNAWQCFQDPDNKNVQSRGGARREFR